ncbi:MAG TPA: DUF1515 family protein [Mesorhizobium sp.]|jgi:hypothetical protein|uniref:DUF1515 family protein n=1 Tax=Mesorhizobium sp. TaxID=1871066 RepID=UPI002DDD4660|nr:DUF1515 family protein [Mesorhizobium sp.]HEV2502314.1 DUF1515 family protein [Mesorhizobium sp.]
MTTRLDDISEAIGGLRADMKALYRLFETSERRALDHRKGVHRRMDDLVGEVSDVKETVAAATGSIDTLKAEVTKIKDVTDDVERMRQRAIGAGTLGKWLWRAGYVIMGAAGGFAGAIAFLTGRPPP